MIDVRQSSTRIPVCEAGGNGSNRSACRSCSETVVLASRFIAAGRLDDAASTLRDARETFVSFASPARVRAPQRPASAATYPLPSLRQWGERVNGDRDGSPHFPLCEVTLAAVEALLALRCRRFPQALVCYRDIVANAAFHELREHSLAAMRASGTTTAAPASPATTKARASFLWCHRVVMNCAVIECVVGDAAVASRLLRDEEARCGSLEGINARQTGAEALSLDSMLKAMQAPLRHNARLSNQLAASMAAGATEVADKQQLLSLFFTFTLGVDEGGGPPLPADGSSRTGDAADPPSPAAVSRVTPLRPAQPRRPTPPPTVSPTTKESPANTQLPSGSATSPALPGVLRPAPPPRTPPPVAALFMANDEDVGVVVQRTPPPTPPSLNVEPIATSLVLKLGVDGGDDCERVDVSHAQVVRLVENGGILTNDHCSGWNEPVLLVACGPAVLNPVRSSPWNLFSVPCASAATPAPSLTVTPAASRAFCSRWISHVTGKQCGCHTLVWVRSIIDIDGGDDDDNSDPEEERKPSHAQPLLVPLAAAILGWTLAPSGSSDEAPKWVPRRDPTALCRIDELFKWLSSLAEGLGDLHRLGGTLDGAIVSTSFVHADAGVALTLPLAASPVAGAKQIGTKQHLKERQQRDFKALALLCLEYASIASGRSSVVVNGALVRGAEDHVVDRVSALDAWIDFPAFCEGPEVTAVRSLGLRLAGGDMTPDRLETLVRRGAEEAVRWTCVVGRSQAHVQHSSNCDAGFQGWRDILRRSAQRPPPQGSTAEQSPRAPPTTVAVPGVVPPIRDGATAADVAFRFDSLAPEPMLTSVLAEQRRTVVDGSAAGTTPPSGSRSVRSLVVTREAMVEEMVHFLAPPGGSFRSRTGHSTLHVPDLASLALLGVGDEARRPLSFIIHGEDAIDAASRGVTSEVFALVGASLLRDVIGMCAFGDSSTEDEASNSAGATSAKSSLILDAEQQRRCYALGALLAKALVDGRTVPFPAPRLFFLLCTGFASETTNARVAADLPVSLLWSALRQLDPVATHSLWLVHTAVDVASMGLMFSNDKGAAVTETNRSAFLRDELLRRLVHPFATVARAVFCGYSSVLAQAAEPDVCRALLAAPHVAFNLTCGRADIAANDIVGSLEFRGWEATDATPYYLCCWLHDVSSAQRSRFLRLCTSVPNPPINGFHKRIAVFKADELYARTCFLQLSLPDFGTFSDLSDALSVALDALELDPRMTEPTP